MSNALFWLKYVGLIVLLILIAVGVLFLRYSQQNQALPDGVQPTKSLSKGMTDFYTSYKLSSSKPFSDDLGDFVIEVNENEEPLSDRLASMESLQKPISPRWQGEYKFRTFKAGTTLREAITNFAESEGMQVIWELDQDFIIKHQFQLDNTIIGSLGKIAKAIDANFTGKVNAFVCPKQRSLVITNKANRYLRENCTLSNV